MDIEPEVQIAGQCISSSSGSNEKVININTPPTPPVQRSCISPRSTHSAIKSHAKKSTKRKLKYDEDKHHKRQQTDLPHRQNKQHIVRGDVTEWAKKRGTYIAQSHVSRLTSKKLTQEGRGDSRAVPATVLKADTGSLEGGREGPSFRPNRSKAAVLH
jgi:hypothetical protein